MLLVWLYHNRPCDNAMQYHPFTINPLTESHRTCSLPQAYSQTLDAVPLSDSREITLRVLLYGGVPPNPPSLLEYVAMAVIMMVLFMIDAASRSPLTSLVVLVLAVVIACAGRKRCSCCRVMLLLATLLYNLTVVTNILLLKPSFPGNKQDAALMAAKVAGAPGMLRVKASLLVVGGALIGMTCWKFVPKRINPEEQILF